MISRKRIAPRLEALEERWVPTSYRFDGSNLLIYNITTPTLIVTEGAANNNFTVNGIAFAVTGNLTIQQGNNAKDNIAVNLNSTVGLTGTLNVTTGNGQSTVSVDGLAGGTGLLAGNAQIRLGNAGGTVNLGTVNGLNDRGNLSLTVPALANNTLQVGGGANASTFAGNSLVFSNFNNVTLGGGAGTGDTFRGNVYVSDPTNAIPGTVTLGTNAAILGNFSVTGGTGNTTVNVNGTSVGGALSVNLQSGTNALNFGSGGATTVGSLNYTSGNGNTTFTASNAGGTAVTVQNGAQFNWGNGVNSFGNSSSFTVNNNLVVNNGNGELNVSTNTFQGNVLCGLTVNAGNGNNSFTLDTTGAVGAGGAGTTNFNYGTNNGGNSVTINNTTTTPTVLNVNFGSSGANLFTLNAGSPGTGQITGSVAWATPTAANAGNGFVDNGYVFTGFITLTNVPS